MRITNGKALVVSDNCSAGCGMPVALVCARGSRKLIAYCPGCGTAWTSSAAAQLEAGTDEVVSLEARAASGADLATDADLSPDCGFVVIRSIPEDVFLTELAELNARVTRRAEATRVVGTVWAMCKRPRLFMSAGRPSEIVSFFAGLVHYLRCSTKLHDEAIYRFEEWLRQRHDVPTNDHGTKAILHLLLTRAPADSFSAVLWEEFELFATEVLGVPQGTFPLEVNGCSYGSR